jgi:ribosomal protein S18 acetylase RimI-like enzyme
MAGASLCRSHENAGVIELRVLSADDWAAWRELRLASLGDAPGAFGATLADWAHEGEQRWRQRLTDVPFNVLADLDGKPAGMVSGTAPDGGGEVELISMWVAPFARGRGVGDALVAAVVRWAEDRHARHVGLQVFDHNKHAMNLYRRNGFVRTDGSHLTRRLSRA